MLLTESNVVVMIVVVSVISAFAIEHSCDAQYLVVSIDAVTVAKCIEFIIAADDVVPRDVRRLIGATMLVSFSIELLLAVLAVLAVTKH